MIVVFITCKDKEEGTKIAKALLSKKLVACAKFTGDIFSYYFWPPKSGTIEEAKEVLLICETLEEKWKNLEEEVTKLSSYDTPSVFALPTSHVSQKYLSWLKGEVE